MATMHERIARCGIALLAEAGPRGANLRAIAERADVPLPTLQHHFPSKDKLYRAIFATALDDHRRDSEATIASLAPLAGQPDLARAAASALLNGWLTDQRPGTTVLLVLLARSARGEAPADLVLRWSDAVAAALSGLLGCDAATAMFIVELLVGLALTSVAPDRAAALDLLNREVIGHALGRPKRRAIGARRRAFREAAVAADPLSLTSAFPDRPAAEAALRAGVTIMAEAGAESLTYRNVARAAAISPTSVLNSFPTRKALMLAVYEEVRRRFASPSGGLPADEAEGDADVAALFGRMLTEAKAGRAPLMLASCELFLAAAWEAELADQAWHARLARGVAHRDDGGAAADFHPHVLSLWSLGLGLLHHARQEPDTAAAIRRALANGLAILAPGSAPVGADNARHRIAGVDEA